MGRHRTLYLHRLAGRLDHARLDEEGKRDDRLLLAAHALGLGGIWIHRAKEEFEEAEWQKLLASLGVEGEWEGIGHCAVGYIDGEPPEAAPRKENRVYFIE